MSDPFRLQVLKALTAAFEEITPANGYAHDLSGKVFRGRTSFGEDDPIPMVCILEAIEQEQPGTVSMPNAAGMSNGPWVLLIQGFVDDDPQNPTDPAHILMADVKKRLAAERPRERQHNILGMGGRVHELKISPGVVRPPDDISGKAYFWLRITLGMVENLSDPYL